MLLCILCLDIILYLSFIDYVYVVCFQVPTENQRLLSRYNLVKYGLINK